MYVRVIAPLARCHADAHAQQGNARHGRVKCSDRGDCDSVNACMHDRCMDAPAYAAASACDDLLLASSKHAVSREAVTVLCRLCACANSCMCMHGGRVMPLLRVGFAHSSCLDHTDMAPSCSLKGRPHGSCFATTKGYLQHFL
jgi:hypothetical protein